MYRFLTALTSSSNIGSLDGSVPDLEVTGFRANTTEEQIKELYLQLPLTRFHPHLDPHPQAQGRRTTHCRSITRDEECGTIATANPLTGYEFNLLDVPEDHEGIDAI